MIIHPESLHKLERQTHAEIIRQNELHRIARAARPRRPGLLNVRRYPRAVAMARRWWHLVTGFFTRPQRPPARIPGTETGRPTITVTPTTVPGPPTNSSWAASR